jgi:hypothetical protein
VPFVAVVYVGATACRPVESAPAPRSKTRSSLGALSLQIQLGGARIPDITYMLTRGGDLVRSGKFISEGQSESFTAVVGGLAADDRYLITFSAIALSVDTGLPQPCGGQAAFGVIAGATTTLSVRVRCAEAGMSGSAGNGATAAAGASASPTSLGAGVAAPNVAPSGPVECASIDSMRAVPAEAPVGKSVVLKSEILPGDGATPPQYAWTADIGLISEASSARASFACTEPGVATVTLTLTDSRSLCRQESVFVYVTCIDPGDLTQQAGAGGQP